MEKRVFQNPKIKDKVTVLKKASETNYRYMLLEVELAPKGGNGLHYHTSFSEEFIPVEGILGVGLGKNEFNLLPGESSTVAVKQMHRFFNPTDKDIKFQVKIVPANEGFLQGLQIAYGLAEDGLTNNNGVPKKLDHLAILLELSDTEASRRIGIYNAVAVKEGEEGEEKGRV